MNTRRWHADEMPEEEYVEEEDVEEEDVEEEDVEEESVEEEEVICAVVFLCFRQFSSTQLRN